MDSEDKILPVDAVDERLKLVTVGCPNMRKFVVIVTSDFVLLSVAEECLTLQEFGLLLVGTCRY